ncbi:MAG: ABC transporter ATP-binding protein [Deltaproteobacteria bacterium]|nr:ABC transporter ATP-binding protein [Deltaproteobacteria bacterium]
MTDAVLRVRGLRTQFETERGLVKAVDGVSLDLRAGETLALVGESGSGKSMTALSILGLVPAPGVIAAGEVWLEGQDLRKLDEASLRRVRGDQIAIVFQDPLSALNPFLTIERQLTEVLEVHRGMFRREARRQAAEMLARVGLSDPEVRLEQYPHQLSGGMRQRVMIAMALLLQPKVLIADEPTTALDVTIQAQILELLRSEAHRAGMSVLLITHDLGVVAGMADRVLVMYAGRIVEEAPIEPLFAEPLHPYTRGLLASVPRLDVPGERTRPIPGAPPDLARLPPGCPFRPRCDRAFDRCSADPALIDVAPARRAACFDLERKREGR